MAENRKYGLLTEHRLGKGRVIVWGIDYYQIGELQQVTMLHRLSEYLRSPNQPFVPLSLGVKNIIRPGMSNLQNKYSPEIIHSDKDQYIHIIYTENRN